MAENWPVKKPQTYFPQLGTHGRAFVDSDDPSKYERVRIKCPGCGWDRILRLRPNQSEVECVCGHRLPREHLDEHTVPMPDHLDAADRHMVDDDG